MLVAFTLSQIDVLPSTGIVSDSAFVSSANRALEIIHGMHVLLVPNAPRLEIVRQYLIPAIHILRKMQYTVISVGDCPPLHSEQAGLIVRVGADMLITEQPL